MATEIPQISDPLSIRDEISHLKSRIGQLRQLLRLAEIQDITRDNSRLAESHKEGGKPDTP